MSIIFGGSFGSSSTSRNRTNRSDDFPAPVRPHTPIVSPPVMSKFTPSARTADQDGICTSRLQIGCLPSLATLQALPLRASMLPEAASSNRSQLARTTSSAIPDPLSVGSAADPDSKTSCTT
ncbi:hypothetical protein BLNAU_3882 [Blattamonas nauphoetae]|uniref:Uncharacterized protein n=1 Tax=Blattamonas nauphoetae TaxID=2049346 RepID=A0ABQ9YBX5_9EUKA|nr:hypothetical protein BLNAU_3882 [Blattamonas nauphoetae]